MRRRGGDGAARDVALKGEEGLREGRGAQREAELERARGVGGEEEAEYGRREGEGGGGGTRRAAAAGKEARPCSGQLPALRPKQRRGKNNYKRRARERLDREISANPASASSSCVTLGESLNLFKPHSLCLYNGY